MLCKIIINVTEQTAPKITKTLSLQTFTYLLPSTSEASVALDMQKLCYKQTKMTKFTECNTNHFSFCGRRKAKPQAKARSWMSHKFLKVSHQQDKILCYNTGPNDVVKGISKKERKFANFCAKLCCVESCKSWVS